MATRVKVGSRYQIAVPVAVRQQLHIEPGDHLLIDVRDGYVVLVPEAHDHSKRLRGLHREIWDGVDPQAYVRQERGAWQE